MPNRPSPDFAFTQVSPTAADLFFTMASRYMSGDLNLMQMKVGDRTYSSPVTFKITNPVNNLNFGNFSWGKQRWIKFCREYLDIGFIHWLENLPNIHRGAESGYNFPVIANHEHGNCIVHISYHEYEPAITVLSRASLLIPTGILEMSLASMVSVWLSKKLNRTVPIYWLISQVQFGPLLAFFYLYHQWWPKVNQQQWLNRSNFAMTGFKRQLTRLEKYKAGERFKYQRENRVLQAVLDTEKYPEFTPEYVLCDGEYYQL